VKLMEAEGVIFKTNANVGHNIKVDDLRRDFDAIVLCGGATRARDLPVPGRELGGIHQAMEFLPWANRLQEGDVMPDGSDVPPITAAGKHVVIIGGGDTGADCLGTAHRQGAASITQLEILSRPPDDRAPGNPWPQWSLIYRVSSAHEEGGERVFSVNTERFIDDGAGNVRAMRIHDVEMADGRFDKVPGSAREVPAELVLLAMGFVGPERGTWLEHLGVALDERGNLRRDDTFASRVPGVFVAGDMGRGQSLIVWAIAEGRACAAGVDRYLMGETTLPAPIAPTTRPLT
ncbi:MAG: FAD-dependent oxidoreductase, partial [Acidimicrobiia bacterium]|nr:FAD-dependent oxidoreductase [Acidimicrobiia bacterium]